MKMTIDFKGTASFGVSRYGVEWTEIAVDTNVMDKSGEQVNQLILAASNVIRESREIREHDAFELADMLSSLVKTKTDWQCDECCNPSSARYSSYWLCDECIGLREDRKRKFKE
jgi:lipopolysaccharide biosynthesis regulator YciM